MRLKSIHTILASLVIVLALSCACRGTGRKSTAASRVSPVRYGYEIINTYPHDTNSYTQGLYWHDGYLWEGTGQWGVSSLNKVGLETGKIIRSVPLDENFFGEGIALLNGTIFQLTWTDGVAIAYDSESLEPKGRFRYSGEGWGLTTDGEMLYMSDGTSQISVVDPSNFKRLRKISVKMDGRSLYRLNELEWIDGKIWANVYMTSTIVIIDPRTGVVEGTVDLSGILPESDRTPTTDVLNGIAWDPETGRIFVTGKCWNKLFEIKLTDPK